MNFASDTRGARRAGDSRRHLPRANEGFCARLRNDAWTARVGRRFAEIFEREVAVFLVPPGTAAKRARAAAHLAPPWARCSAMPNRHIATANAGRGIFRRRPQADRAPGSRQCHARNVAQDLAERQWRPASRWPAVAVSRSDPSRAPIYRPATKVPARCRECRHARGPSPVHMDGARLANALVR